MARIRLLAAGIALALLTILAVPASAQYVGVPPPSVPGGNVGADSGGRTPVAVAPASGAIQASSGRLALTGTDVMQLVVLAGAMVLAGVVLTRSARRKRITA